MGGGGDGVWAYEPCLRLGDPVNVRVLEASRKCMRHVDILAVARGRGAVAVLLALCARGAAAEDELRLRLALERIERVCMPPGLERLSTQPPEEKWALEKWRRERGEGDNWDRRKHAKK